MSDADYSEFVGYMLGAFGVGLASGYLLMAFHALIKSLLPGR